MPTIDVNDYTINYQTGTLLADIIGQATGSAVLAPVTESQFVSVATVALKTAPDVVMNAISQVISKTIFSIRPYRAKFAGLRMDEARWGNHVRKLNVIDKPFEDDERYVLTDGYSIDHWKVNKPDVLQTNFYGSIAVQKHVTTFRDQLNIAFSGSAEFERFISMVMQNVSDMLEQERETVARNTVNNLIAGVYSQATAATPIAPERLVYLVDEYNTATGLSLTAAQIKTPTYFGDFARWLFGYLKTISDRLSNRTILYHQNFTISLVARNIMRHTPIDRTKMYLYGPIFNNIASNVLSMVFYDDYLRLADHEFLDFWQSVKTPMKIDTLPTYTAADGTLTTPLSHVEVDQVLGVIFDEDACGMTEKGQWTATTPMNAAGGYFNTYWHENIEYFNDFTENCVVLLLAAKPSSKGDEKAEEDESPAKTEGEEPAETEETKSTKTTKKAAK